MIQEQAGVYLPSLPNQKLHLNQIAASRGQSLAQMALAWVLRDEGVASVLIGVSKVSQLEDNIRCLENTSFTEDELKAIDNIVFRNSR